MKLTHPKLSVVPVMPVQLSKLTLCMPTGRFICPISPARKEEWKEWKEKENKKMRNEEARAAGLKTI